MIEYENILKIHGDGLAKALEAKPENPSSSPQPHMVEGKNQVLKVVLSYVGHSIHVHLHTIDAVINVLHTF